MIALSFINIRYMDTVLKVLIHGGHYVRDDVVNSVTQSISESPEMYAFIGENPLLLSTP